MNKPLHPPSMADATLLSASLQSAVLSYADNPAAAEQKIIQDVRARYIGSHPDLPRAENVLREAEEQIDDFRERRERHREAMRVADLLSEPKTDRRDSPLMPFDQALFLGMAGIGVLGSAVALTNVATYVADSAMLPSMTDNFVRALFFTSTPFSASALIKAIIAFQGNSKSERALNLKLAKYAGVFVGLHIVSLAVYFAPQKLDPGDLAQALANGVSPVNPIVASVKTVASYLVLGTGLFAEMFIAPVVINYATKLHKAGRKIIYRIHDEQITHRAAIAEINGELNKLVVITGLARAEIQKHEAAIVEMTEATQHQYRSMAADLKAAERRTREEFFAKQTKGSSK